MHTQVPSSRTVTAARSSAAALVLALVAGLLVACNTGEIPRSGDRTGASSTAEKTRALGESSAAFTFDGPASQSIPSYHERLAVHLLNRMRMDPPAHGVTGPMGGRVPPQIPFRTDPSMVEAGRWQGQHAISKNCYCDQQSMMSPPPDRLKNSCCTMARKKGKVVCTSPRVACESPDSTEETRRWNLLGTGTASITDEFYFNTEAPRDQAPPALAGDLVANALAGSPGFFTRKSVSAFGVAQVAQPKPPEKCLTPKDPCDTGTCQNPSNGNTTCDKEQNPACTGVCVSQSECGGTCTKENPETGEEEPVVCNLPEPPNPEECKPSEYPIGYYVSFLQGTTTAPIPTIFNGLHWKLGYTQGQNGVIDRFGTTPIDEIGFGIHYYEPAGEAKSANVVIDGSCNALSVTKRNIEASPTSETDVGPIAGDGGTADTADSGGSTDPESYHGLRYGTSVSLQRGCHRYVFSFEDANGFHDTYPRYGSLGAKVALVDDGNGNMVPTVVANDDTCPIWSDTRPDLSCLPEADQCVAGETQRCYTGRDNTRGQGMCSLGTEECQNGRWSGTCKNEVTPKSDETCDDGIDNDCNGFVDEGCGSSGGGDAGGNEDAGTGDTNTSQDTGTEDSGTNEDSGVDTGTDEDDTGTSPDASETEDDGGSGSDSGISITPSDDGGDDDSSSGCGCSSSGGTPPMWPAFMVFAGGFVALRRRNVDRR